MKTHYLSAIIVILGFFGAHQTSQAASRYAELTAVLITDSGKRIEGEFRFSMKADPNLYTFRRSSDEKFELLELDTIVQVIVSNKSGIIGYFESMPYYESRNKLLLYHSGSKKRLMLIKWANDYGVLSVWTEYRYDYDDNVLKLYFNPTSDRLCFRSMNAMEYTELLTYIPNKSTDDILKLNQRFTSFSEKARDEYFSKYCKDFLGQIDSELTELFNPEEFLQHFGEVCGAN